MEASSDEYLIYDDMLENSRFNIAEYDVVSGRRPVPVCHWSPYELRNGLDHQFLCNMPMVVGFLAIAIALSKYFLMFLIVRP